MDVTAVKVGVPRIDEARLFGRRQRGFNGFKLGYLCPINFGSNPFQEGVGRQVAPFEFVADFFDMFSDTLLQGHDGGQHAPRRPLVTSQ